MQINMIRILYHFKAIFFSVFFLMICSTLAMSQQGQLDTLVKRFDRYRINLPQEKIYVHVAQELFLTGERLWFKVYYVDGALHRPLDISKVVYVEIIDTENRPILQAKVALKNGIGSGSFFLPASINSGNFHLRAYTQWMKNFSPEYFFHKRISIVNSFRKLEKPQVGVSKNFSAQFFPEGGNLVYGLKSKVAFQATDNTGKGINFSGIILNNNNDTIATINPFRYGIGSFTITPVVGESYKAVLKDSLGNSKIINLPAPKSNGLVMEVRDSTSEMLALHVSASASMHQSTPYFYYFIHSRQVISSSGLQFFEKGKSVVMIPKKTLNEGISHITVFDSELRPQAERLYFKPSEKKLQLNIHTNQQEYGIRRKVILDITETSGLDTLNNSLSVSVVKSDSLQGNLSGNIFNYLWFSSDLKGDIEEPSYYTQATSPEVVQALDNLMLTHGWRRFSWDDVLNNNHEPAFIPEYRGHLIQGTVVDAKGKPVRGIPTFLSSPGKNIQLYTAFSKPNGVVLFEMKDFFGSKKIVVQARSEIDSTVRAKIQNPFSDVYALRKIPPLELQQSMSKNVLTRSIAMQVQDIYYGDDSLKFTTKGIDSTAFYGRANETYFLDDYTRFPVMEEVMREYIPGVMVRKRKDGFHFLVLDHVRKSLFQQDPLVLLDGTPIFDIDKIMAFDPLKVKKLEVVTSRYFLGPLIFQGVVSYTTYAGDLGGYQLDPASVSLDYDGLQRQREFYSPQYETQKQRETRMPDRRNLLLWAPHVSLDKSGKSRIEFFTSDLTGDYTILVEGLTQNGYSGSAVGSFTVKQFNN